jgi:hypothetical protein
MKRLFPLLLVLLLVAAGCGEKDPGPRGVGLNAGASEAQVRQDYEDSMERMREQVESPSAPPLDQSIATANRNQLLDAAKRWDQAVAIAKSVTPPEDAAAAHKDLVAAMEGLGDWNRRIAQAAPNKPATKKLARQARKSAESKQFQAAVSSLESAGYVTFVSVPDDPLAGASDPASG